MARAIRVPAEVLINGKWVPTINVSRKIEAGPFQLAYHYSDNPAIEREWGFVHVPGIRWRVAVLLGRLTAWVGAR